MHHLTMRAVIQKTCVRPDRAKDGRKLTELGAPAHLEKHKAQIIIASFLYEFCVHRGIGEGGLFQKAPQRLGMVPLAQQRHDLPENRLALDFALFEQPVVAHAQHERLPVEQAARSRSTMRSHGGK